MTSRPLAVRELALSTMRADQVAALQKLDQWPLAMITDKLVSAGRLSAESIDEHVHLYKQFMFFQGMNSNQRCGMYSIEVDEIWHQHILYTKDYEQFCHEVFGRFIHHTPCNVMDTSPAAMEEYSKWVANLHEVFEGPPLKPRIPPYCMG